MFNAHPSQQASNTMLTLIRLNLGQHAQSHLGAARRTPNIRPSSVTGLLIQKQEPNCPMKLHIATAPQKKRK